MDWTGCDYVEVILCRAFLWSGAAACRRIPSSITTTAESVDEIVYNFQLDRSDVEAVLAFAPRTRAAQVAA